MSAWARTFGLDDWHRIKVYEKDYIWTHLMLIGYFGMVGYMLVWSVIVLTRHSSL